MEYFNLEFYVKLACKFVAHHSNCQHWATISFENCHSRHLKFMNFILPISCHNNSRKNKKQYKSIQKECSVSTSSQKDRNWPTPKMTFEYTFCD